jgi:hypothetical protein
MIHRLAKSGQPRNIPSHGGFHDGQNTRAKGLVPLDGKGWITGGGTVPKPRAWNTLPMSNAPQSSKN